MDEHALLIRHTRAWAETKKRDVDDDLLREVLSLRDRYDALPYGTWPTGSAERLLLTTWPAYGDAVPDLDTLRVTLDTFWSFLRATGRMSAQSASPAELRKEAKRSLPKMQASYDDPARHSTGRVLADFGESIGLSLEGAATMEELQARLDDIQEAWNALPQEERIRRMPDPSPKSNRGAEFSAMVQDLTDTEDEYDDIGDVPELSRSDPRLSAQDARGSGFVQKCLELAAWVGDGRQATARGLLKPAVAREAYQNLDLWPWDRAHNELVFGRREDDPEVDAVLARSALESWRSAGDCLALDRLWFSLESAALVERRGGRVVQTDTLPGTDEEWVTTTISLLVALCERLGAYRHEPLPGILLVPHVNGGSVPVGAIRAWWATRCPEGLRDFPALDWDERLDSALFHFADCNLWTVHDDELALTHLGRDFAVVYLSMLDEGLLED